MSDYVRFEVRLPKALHARIMAEVEKGQRSIARYSANDWLREAAREKLDGPAATAATVGIAPAVAATSIPGVTVGLAANPESPWLEAPRRFKLLSSQDAGDQAQAEFRDLAPTFKKPKDWDRWNLKQRADYLDERFPI